MLPLEMCIEYYLPVFSGVRVTRSLVLCICFADRCLYFSFGHRVFRPSLNYDSDDP
jgi:hypothetical protein